MVWRLLMKRPLYKQTERSAYIGLLDFFFGILFCDDQLVDLVGRGLIHGVDHDGLDNSAQLCSKCLPSLRTPSYASMKSSLRWTA